MKRLLPYKVRKTSFNPFTAASPHYVCLMQFNGGQTPPDALGLGFFIPISAVVTFLITFVVIKNPKNVYKSRFFLYQQAVCL